MPDFDFDAFNHDNDGEGDDHYGAPAETREETVAVPVVKAEVPYEAPPDSGSTEEVDKW